MDAVIRGSGMDKKSFFDIRGNHDKYGVPYVGDKLDFFSNYSISSELNRLGTIQSVSLVGRDWKYIFLGIDDSMDIGLRGPSNLFGHVTDERIETVESELEYWDRDPDAQVTKVVFGHFPMSFTASSEMGKRYESMFGRQSVSAYLCGHLHAKFSKHLWKLHSIELPSDSKQPKKLQQFWEWELGDWKESRLMRILGIDGGQVSFVDIELLARHEPKQDDFQTTILITHPIDSRSMNRINSDCCILRKDISVLVFSSKPIINVTAKVFDSSKDFMLVEELQLHATSPADNGPLFRAKWDTGKYMDASASRFRLQVLVFDHYGKETASSPRPFSVDGKLARLPMTWLAYLVLHIRWETLYSVLLWSNAAFLIVLLLLPKLLNHFMARNASYQKWAMSVSVSLPIGQRRYFFWPLWFLIEGSRDTKLWWAMVLYLFYLFRFPWFFGRATSENGPITSMSMNGWTVQFADIPIRKDGLGTPDIIGITLPFMYLIVSPSFLLIYCLVVERSAFFMHSNRKSSCSKEPISSKMDSEHTDGTPSKSSKSINTPPCRICKGWTRTVLLLVCFVVAYMHFRQCSYLMASYGVGPVALSPGLSWAPPLLLAASVYSTQSSSKSNRAET
ncbi:putative metallophosphoesterase At3g03305 isoform X2 [Magnolia sinica]|nr:putative metallophosphoesterase At3g03305 isoform X2 [Magnolia sinica]